MEKLEVVELLYLGLANSHRCNEPCVDCMGAAELLYEDHFRLPISTMCPNCDERLKISVTKGGYLKTQVMDEQDNLNGIRTALGLPDDTPEPMVGLIWDLQQRIEELEEKIRGPFPHPELQDLDKPEDTSEVRLICGETLGNFICGEEKGHKGHHIGTRITDNKISWPQNIG